jgi:hypothetical protein
MSELGACRTSEPPRFPVLVRRFRLEVLGFLQRQCQFPALFSALFLRYFPSASRFGCGNVYAEANPS